MRHRKCSQRVSLRDYVCKSACVCVCCCYRSVRFVLVCGCNLFPFVLLSKIFNMYSLIFFYLGSDYQFAAPGRHFVSLFLLGIELAEGFQSQFERRTLLKSLSACFVPFRCVCVLLFSCVLFCVSMCLCGFVYVYFFSLKN